jgi:hypothetical protein
MYLYGPRRSIIVGEAHESNSVANLLIRGYTYSGDPRYYEGYVQQVKEFDRELTMLSNLDGDYALDEGAQLAITHLVGMLALVH